MYADAEKRSSVEMHEKRPIGFLPGIFISPVGRIIYTYYFKSAFRGLAVILPAFLATVT